MMRGSGWCAVVSLGSCSSSIGSANRESNSGSESISELLDKGVDVPVDVRVMVATLSQGTNLFRLQKFVVSTFREITKVCSLLF